MSVEMWGRGGTLGFGTTPRPHKIFENSNKWCGVLFLIIAIHLDDAYERP